MGTEMARSVSNARLLSAFIVDRVSVAVSRRGYASAAASGSVREGGTASSGTVVGNKGAEESTKTSSWVPDPVTGYYRPENHGNDIDVAELREMLLKNKVRRY